VRPSRELCVRDPIRGPDDAAALLRCLSGDAEVPSRLLVVGLGGDRRLTGVGIAPPGRGLADFKVWELHALADELDAAALVVGRFARGRPRPPSDAEARAFVDLLQRARAAGVALLDCVVLRGERWWSLAERSGVGVRVRLVSEEAP